MISITPLAAEKIKGIMAEQGEKEAALRVIVVGAGQYSMTLEHDQTEDDQVVHENGIKVLVDSRSAPMLEGSTIDYIEGLTKTGFAISNPNFQAGGCACGGSGCTCGGH